jgi:hypothetical protein
LELIRGGLGFLAGATAPDGQERESFAEGGERGRLNDPRNARYNANRSALEMARGLAKHAAAPPTLRSPMPGKTSQVHVPGVPFALGGAGFGMPAEASIPGLDLGGLLALLEQLLAPAPAPQTTGAGPSGRIPRLRGMSFMGGMPVPRIG